MEREGRLPDFVLVASNRCGSTALSADLRAHPEIFMPKRKEIHFFDREFDRGESWYRAHFRDVGDASVVGEKTPGYMYRADAVDRMATLLPNARLLAIIRNPVDRAYSNYSKNRAMYRETLPFRQAIAAEPDRLAEGRLSFAYLDRGRYLHQFERLCERYPREQLHVVIAEEYWSDRGKNYRDILGFLGVDPDFHPPTPGRIRGSFQAY